MLIKIVELKQFGEVMEDIRKKAKGMNQAELSKKTKFTVHKIGQIENGRMPKLADVVTLAEAMGIKITFAISIDENDIQRLLTAENGS